MKSLGKSYKVLSRRRLLLYSSLLTLILVICIIGSTLIGEHELSIQTLSQTLWKSFAENTDLSRSSDWQILLYVRLPRILLALFVGLALSSSGLAFQCLLRNPLADPYILGVSGGAALGVVLGLLLKLQLEWIYLLAFITSIITIYWIYFFAQEKKRVNPTTLILTGAIFNAFTFSLILVSNAFAEPTQTLQIWGILTGRLQAQDYWQIVFFAGLCLSGFAYLFYHSGQMNLASLSENHAEALGFNVHQLRIKVFIVGSIMVCASVTLAGLIGFVGLFVPHLCRLIVGNDHRLLLPFSALFGASFLIFSDTLARSVLINTQYHSEIPVGAVTALFGAPFFLYLLHVKKNNLKKTP